MDDILEQTKLRRFQFLHALYKKTGGNEHQHPNMKEIGDELGLSATEVELITQYLKGEHLLKFAAMGGFISITHSGVVQVERALSAPERPTHYFPPVVNILHIGTVSDSHIQQAGAHSTLTITANTVDSVALMELGLALRTALDELRKSTARSSELESMIATVEAQAASTSPNVTIVQEALKTVRNILEGMGGSVLAAELLHKIGHWLH